MITIKDIANETGLSISICSRYFNHRPVRKENAKTIKEAAERTGYIPNELARNLRKAKTSTIGAIVPNLLDSFSLAILDNLEAKLKEKKYSLIVVNSRNNSDYEYENVVSLIKKKVEAIVMLPITNSSKISQACTSNNVPLIIYDQHRSNIKEADYVLFENEKGSQNAVNILVKNGHKNILVITGPKNDYTPSKRIDGVSNLLKENPNLNIEFIEAPDYTANSAYKMMLNFKNLHKFTAIFSTNFDMTLGTLKALNELNIRIPEDISLMGFDLLPTYDFIKPNIWSVYQSIEEIADSIFNEIFKEIEGTNKTNETVFVPFHIKQGNSIKNLNGGKL